jgi:LPS O-antigen subunit length determinant protein (WzzB/FepE family)
MSFLYGECAPQRRRELGAHLAGCPTCTSQVQTWRSSINTLDEWPLPARPRATRQWFPIFKWAAAAAVVLATGFAMGRQTSNARAEVASLKESVNQLSALVQSEHTFNLSNSVAMAASANTETLHLLNTYARLQQEQRASDQEVIKTALRTFDLRLGRVRTDLQTVAVNTQAGFEQTHENLAQLVSFTMPQNE